MYFPAWHGGMLWDDAGHITKASLRSLSGLWRIWFEFGATQQYYPAAHSAFWLMYQLWGEQTLGYHLVNIVLHATSACLFARVLMRLKIPGATTAALLFALHPVQVESVAWMTELKNVLSGVGHFGAALCYLRFDDTRRPRAYAAALGLFVLAIFSKTVTATLPAGLLVVFWWQRGRIDWRRDVRPLLPFFAIGAIAGLTTAWVEHTYIGAQGVDFQIAPVERVLIAGRAICFYLSTLVWPFNLIFIYPRWDVSESVWWQYLFPLGVAVLVAAAWTWRTRSRAPLAALLFFIGTLGPALGFVNVYPFRYSFVADHFQYLACAGVFAFVAAGLSRLRPATARTSANILIAVLAVASWRETRQYVDAETLYRTILERDPASWFAHNNLATLLINRSPSDTQAAVDHLNQAIRLKPDPYPEAHYNLGLAFDALNRPDGAAVQYRTVVALQPNRIEPHRNLAEAAIKLGRFDEAADELRIVIAMAPDDADAHFNLGASLFRLGRPAEAVAQFREVLRIHPNDSAALAAIASIGR